jgi:DNA helicase-2/ATP-dependent DNA helicase PcrA
MKRRDGDRRPEYTLMDLAPDPIIGAVVKLAALAKNAAPFATAEELEDIAVAHGIQPENGWADEVSSRELALLASSAMHMATERDGTLDFDDMIFLPVYHGWARPTYSLIVVDEAQDMNASQLTLAIACAKGRIVVVGDDRQAIYGFRGADSNALDRLRAELHASELPLTTTYRCPRHVVALAAQIVPDYTAAPTAPDGRVLRFTERQMMESAVPSDFILSRTNAPLARIALALLRSGKRARIEGRDLSRTLLALVKRMKCDTVPALMAKLSTWAEREREKIMATRASDAAKTSRLDMISDQVATIDALSDGLAETAELTARIEELFADQHGPSIVCSTVHKAKGLEAERVFVLTDTLYCNGKRRDTEEENIHYVALTRAKDTLILVSEKGGA